MWSVAQKKSWQKQQKWLCYKNEFFAHLVIGQGGLGNVGKL